MFKGTTKGSLKGTTVVYKITKSSGEDCVALRAAGTLEVVAALPGSLGNSAEAGVERNKTCRYGPQESIPTVTFREGPRGVI